MRACARRACSGAAFVAAIAAWLACGEAQAHAFGRVYNLPVPYWLYAFGASAALVLSFAVVAWFATRADAPPRAAAAEGSRPARVGGARALTLLRVLAVALLGLSILTGLLGSRDPYRNFSMTGFWILFVLGVTYLTALLGDVYALASPWRVLVDGAARLRAGFGTGRARYPAQLAYWPACALYAAFIWIELFGHTRPFSLALLLAAYTALNLAGAWWFGARDWFRYCEFFAVMLRLVGLMAPVALERDAGGLRLRLRLPLAGLVEQRAEHPSLLVFILFMLSSTAFDGLRATAFWFAVFWKDAFGLFTPLIGENPIRAYVELRGAYIVFESLCLLLSPFLYLGLYLAFVWLGRQLARSTRPLRELALDFALSLVPIALVYHVTHYYTLLFSQGVKIAALVSDPFGWGWNLFGTAHTARAPVLLDMGLVWHSQVLLILLGHVAAVYVAHLAALQRFDRRGATLSQLPMLLLMVLFTSAGLWILAQPLQAGRG